MMRFNEFIDLQNEILSGGLGWNQCQDRQLIHPASLANGPEMDYLGPHYGAPDIPLKIAFLGINTNYEEGSEMMGSPQWMRDLISRSQLRFDVHQMNNPPFLNDITLNQYTEIRTHYQRELRDVTFFCGRGRGGNSNYTLPLVLEESYRVLHDLGFITQNPNGGDPLQFAIDTISLSNLFPFQGNGDAGILSGGVTRYPHYGHIPRLYDILTPQIVFIFGGKAWDFVNSRLNPCNLEFPNSEYYIAYRTRSDGQRELWISLYHFSHTGQYHPMEEFRENIPAIFREFFPRS
jgi:hypothetical protein